MARKFRYPGTYVPGANPAYDDRGAPIYDKKGRRVWHMPKIVKNVEHKFHSLERQINTKTGKLRKTKVPRIVLVPVYKGMSALMANWYRGQARRNIRKRAERVGELQKILNDPQSSEDAKIIARDSLRKEGVEVPEEENKE
jgi:hypothetical protein